MAKAIKKAEETKLVEEKNDDAVIEATASVEERLPEETRLEEVIPAIPPVEMVDTPEIMFLRRILHIQHDGGFGRHLDDLINQRIKEIQCQ